MKPLLGRAREYGPEIQDVSDDAEKRLHRIRSMVRLLDSAFEIPGTQWRIGLDAIIGLIPGVGDIVTTALSAWILHEARLLGVRRRTLAKMTWNVTFDFLVGAVPLAGDVFDAVWKANVKNLELIERDLAKRKVARPEFELKRAESSQHTGSPLVVEARPIPYSDQEGVSRVKPQVATAAIVAIVSAIASFMSGAFWGLILAIVAVVAGVLGMLIAASPRRRGGLLSLAAIILGVIALVRAIVVALF